jgi:large subunit ribosomal protein L35
MAKLKTHKASAKRFQKTKTGKFQKRTAGQDHYNSREPGKVTRNKRKNKDIYPAIRRSLIDLLPN